VGPGIKFRKTGTERNALLLPILN